MERNHYTKVSVCIIFSLRKKMRENSIKKDWDFTSTGKRR